MPVKTIFHVAVTETRSTDREGVGKLRFEETSEGTKVYRWCKNDSGGALTAGESVVHDLSDTGDLFQNVSNPATADLSMLAGIVMAASWANGEFGWIQVLGVHNTVEVLQGETTAVAAGDYLKAVNAVNYLDVDAAVQAAYKRNVQSLEAIATITTGATTTVKCVINCLG